MEVLLRNIYKDLISPVGIITAIAENSIGILQKGDPRGSTISTFNILQENHCCFTFGKSRIMASCLQESFAFHYLNTCQTDIAKIFALSNLSSSNQFSGIKLRFIQNVPVLTDFHSLILGQIYERIELSESYVYLAKITHLEINSSGDILHYSNRGYC